MNPTPFRLPPLVPALLLFAFASSALPAASDLPSGSAKGSLTFDDNTVSLTFAGAFVDQKDERKPVVLIVSDKKLPVENWTSDFDIMRDKSKFNGIVFFLDKEGKVYRTDVHMKDRQTAVSGIFDLKLDGPMSKELIGSGTGTSSRGTDKLEVTFHATLK